MRLRHLGALLPTPILLAAAVAAAEANAPPTTPLGLCRQNTEKILAILRDPALKGPERTAERRKKIEDVAYELFDWPEIARRALGIHWRDRSEAERKEFTALFTDLVRHTYLTKIDRYSGEQVRYKGEEVEGDYARVSVEIVSARSADIPVVYSLRKQGGTWLIYDVAIEGVRLVNNYRSQFNSMLDGMPYAKFIAKLRDKVKAIQEEK